MKLQQIFEVVSDEQHKRFEKWKQDCKRADPDATFAGSIGMGAQAVNWVKPGNRVVGDWNGDSMTGTVNKAPETSQAHLKTVPC